MQWVGTEDLCVIILGKSALDDHMPNKVLDSLILVARRMGLELCNCGRVKELPTCNCGRPVERNPLERVVVQDSNGCADSSSVPGSVGMTMDQPQSSISLETNNRACETSV